MNLIDQKIIHYQIDQTFTGSSIAYFGVDLNNFKASWYYNNSPGAIRQLKYWACGLREGKFGTWQQ